MGTHYKAVLYKQLKATGLALPKTYRYWTTEELEEALRAVGVEPIAKDAPVEDDLEIDWESPSPAPSEAAELAPPAGFFGLEEPAPAPAPPPVAAQPNPEELPGQRLNTTALDEVIRIDEQGRRWHQEEVKKPAYPKPRGRRVLKYMDTGVRTETVQAGEYVETFEVAGNETQRPAEVKITLPSYQVGIYTDPRFPFKIHCYDGREGFDFEEVLTYYGGSALVPDTCKRIYIENELCYDIRSVVRSIQAEHRHLQLTGKIQ